MIILEINEKLLKGSLWKGIFIFSLPLFFSNLLQVLFNMTDVAVIGKFSSSTALGAVGSTSMLVTLFTGFLIGMGNGVNVLVARYYATKDEKRLHDCVHTSFLLCLIVGLIIFLMGFLFSKPLLILLKTQKEFLEFAILYLKIYFIGMPAMAIYNFGSACYSAVGKTKKPLLFLSIAGVINVILDLVFVVIFNMGVEGVAIASVISQYVSAILLIVSLYKEKSGIKIIFKDIKLYPNNSLQIIKLGLPSGFQNAIFAIANLFIQSGVNSLSSEVVKGNSAAINADSIVFNVMASFYTACASYVSQNFGAGNKKRILPSYFISLFYAFFTGLVLGILLLIFGKQFLGIFTNENAIIDAGYERVKIMAISYAFGAFMDNSIAASRGLGKTLIPTIIVITGSCIFRVIWVYTVFRYFNTQMSLYLVYLVSWVFTAIFEIIYFGYVYKKYINLDINCEEMV